MTTVDRYLVSACLLGSRCRYDGGTCKNEEVIRFLADKTYKAVCPEQSGGLTAPRAPAEICAGEGREVLSGESAVIDKNGVDRTAEFSRGAAYVLEQAKQFGATHALLKQRSPSCGTKAIYDGTFSGERKPGMGVAARLLQQNGITLLSEEEIED